MKFVEDVIPFLHDKLDEDRRIAIATLVNVDGSSPRPPGAQLGVSEDGQSVGMITGGCAESAIVAEAIACINSGENKSVRYGEGSPYLDVVLPCGAGIDIYIETITAAEIVGAVSKNMKRRKVSYVDIDLDNKCSRYSSRSPDQNQNKFLKIHHPRYRIFVFGEGANLVSFCTNADAAGFGVCAFSPDENTLDFLTTKNITNTHIHRTVRFTELAFDEYTAVVTLFHEHDWETEILRAALNAPTDYIGALGSRKTHAARLAALMAGGPTMRPPTFIRGPIGLDIGGQNPNEISIAILAEIIAHRRGRRS